MLLTVQPTPHASMSSTHERNNAGSFRGRHEGGSEIWLEQARMGQPVSMEASQEQGLRALRLRRRIRGQIGREKDMGYHRRHDRVIE